MAQNAAEPALNTLTPGTDSFSWPYNHWEIQNFVDGWAEKLTGLAQDLDKNTPPQSNALNGGELILINLLKWQPTIVQAIQTLLIKQGFEAAGQQPPIDPVTMPFWHAYITNAPLEDDRYLQGLYRGPHKEPAWKIPLKFLRDVWQKRPVIYKPSFLYNPNKDLTVTLTYGAVSKYCQKTQETGVYITLSHWFRAVKETEVEEHKDPVLDQILEITWAHFEEKCILEEKMKSWIDRQIRISFHITKLLAKEVLQSPNKLPKTLIPGASEPLAILFRYLVYKNGGKTIVFDHGASAVLSFIEMTYLNFLYGTSVFYTFTQLAAHHYKNNIAQKSSFSLDHVSILGTDLLDLKIPQKNQKENKGKILLIPFYDMRDYNLSYAYPSWAQAQDFNVALIQNLKDLGYDIALKTHPELTKAPIEELEGLYNCPVLTSPFEAVIDDYELVITCDLNSTTLISTLLKDKPCIAFNFLNILTSELLAQVSKRLEILNIHINENNQMRPLSPVSKPHIESAINKAHENSLKALYIEGADV